LRCIGTFHGADIKRPRDLITTLHDHQAGCVVAVVVRLLSLTDAHASFVAKVGWTWETPRGMEAIGSLEVCIYYSPIGKSI
jgi:hypothetical protein